MKRFLCIAILAVVVTLPVAASDFLVNVGFNVQADMEWDFSRRSVSVVFTSLGSDSGGFYWQVAPYFALSSKSGASTTSYLENDLWGGGLTFTLGYGRDINLGQFGVILGGGFFGNLYAQYNTYMDYLYYNPAAGIGGGAHAYFQLQGGMILNAGLDAAWRPLHVYGSDSGFGEVLFQPRGFNVNINAGIGTKR